MIDLRSDTVTKPTGPMFEAMMKAELGDDVLGDDPTVIQLQEKIARLLGKEAAVFVPSGTMANQIAIRAHTEPGCEAILEETSHTFYYETGGMAALAGVQSRLIKGKRGLLKASEIEPLIRPSDVHFPITKMVILENSHNHGGGTVYPIEQIKEIHDLCQRHELVLHLDGARIWNASIALGCSLREITENVDTVSVCLSKGLGAPVGSCLAGSREFIGRARRFRKMYGGGMRQAGILAAAAIYALDHQFDRLKEDHENARTLAEAVSEMPGAILDLEEVQTNLVYFGFENINPAKLEKLLADQDILVFAERSNAVRAVTHLGIGRKDIDQVIQTLRGILKTL